MAFVAEELILNVRANTAQAVAGLGVVSGKVKSLATTASASMMAAGSALTKGLTLPIVGMATLGTKSFADFDSAMSQSLAIMSDEAMSWRDDMEASARDVAKTTTFSATEAAESYFFLASAGLDARQSIAALPQVAAFAQAGMFDMATATDLATDAQSALGLTVKDPTKNLENLTRVTDTLVKANTLANASVEQFSSALTTKAGAAAKTLGIEVEETTAILAVLADQGVKGQIAGTQLAMMLNNLTTNAVKNRKEFDRYGISVFDANGEVRNMADIVQDMTTAFGDMSDEQKVAAIANLGFGDRAANTLKLLIGNEDALRNYEGALRSSSGFTDRVANKQLDSFTARWDLLKSKLVDVGLTLGGAILPGLTDFVEKAGPTIETIGEWIKNNEELALKIAAVGAAIGPVLLIGGKLIGLLRFLNPWVALITAAVVGVAWAMDHFGVTFEDVLKVIRDWGQKALKWIEDSLGRIWEVIGPVVEEVAAFFQKVFGDLVDWFTRNWPLILATIKDVLGAIRVVWEAVWPHLHKILRGAWEAIQGIIEGALKVVTGLFQFWMAVFQGDWKAAWDAVKRVFSGIWSIMKGIVRGFFRIIGGVVSAGLDLIKEVWERIWGQIGDFVKGVWDGIVGAIEWGINRAIDAINILIDGLNSLVGVADFLLGPGINIGEIPNLKNIGAEAPDNTAIFDYLGTPKGAEKLDFQRTLGINIADGIADRFSSNPLGAESPDITTNVETVINLDGVEIARVVSEHSRVNDRYQASLA